MIYFLRSPDTGLVKIGTTGNYHLRLSQLIAEHGDLELLGLMDGVRLDEQALHRQFAADRVHHEWFRFSDAVASFVEANTHLQIPNTERDLVNIQLDRDVHTMLTLLRDRYGERRLSDAVRRFIAEKDETIAEAARKIEEQRAQAANPEPKQN